MTGGAGRRPTKPCECCGTAIEMPPGLGAKRWAARRFCTLECAARHRRGEAPAAAPTTQANAPAAPRPMWRPAGFALRPGDAGYGGGS